MLPRCLHCGFPILEGGGIRKGTQYFCNRNHLCKWFAGIPWPHGRNTE